MSSEDEIAAIQAGLLDKIRRKEPGWQEASLAFFMLRATEPPAHDYEISIEKVTNTAPPASSSTDSPSVEKSSPTPQAAQRAASPFVIPPGILSGLSKFPLIFPASISLSRTAVIGRDVERATDVAIGEVERCGGLYVLGQPRTGKSNLLISLALSDIQNGHGILFIDPHTDAINDLVSRIPASRREDVILLDPTDKTRSFGINLLHCVDPRDPIELDNTVGRVLDIFAKVWGDSSTGRLGIWLEKLLANSVYLLLENPGYTLVDIPPLLWEDTTFRNTLLKECKG